MTEPVPSREQFDRVRSALLRSARRDAPAPKALTRTMGALGLGAAVMSETAQAATVAAHAAKLGLLKWFGMGVVAGVTVLGGYEATQTRSQHTQGAPAAVAPAPTPERVGLPTTTSPAALIDTAPTLSVPPAQKAAPVPQPAAAPRVEPAIEGTPTEPPSLSAAPPQLVSLDEEVALIDAARQALQAGDSASCLQVLDRYRDQFPTPQLGLEAGVLRVDALARRGDCSTARALAIRMIGSSPRGPAANRLRALLRSRCGIDLD